MRVGTIFPLLGGLFIGAAFAADCPDGYTKLSNNKCYQLLSTVRTYAEASKACNRVKGQLVDIQQSSDNSMIATYLGSKQQSQAWIGLTCSDGYNCNWADGGAFIYRNFNDNPPDTSASKNCFYITSGPSPHGIKNAWYSSDCTKAKKLPLCEYEDPASSCGTYFEYRLKCYQYKEDLFYPEYAEADCKKDGGQLASIHDYAVNTYLYYMIRAMGETNSALIGLSVTNGTYSWTDGTPVDANFTAPQIPVKDPSCFALSAGDSWLPQKWISQRCHTASPYICQRSRGAHLNLQREEENKVEVAAPKAADLVQPVRSLQNRIYKDGIKTN